MLAVEYPKYSHFRGVALSEDSINEVAVNVYDFLRNRIGMNAGSSGLRTRRYLGLWQIDRLDPRTASGRPANGGDGHSHQSLLQYIGTGETDR